MAPVSVTRGPTDTSDFFFDNPTHIGNALTPGCQVRKSLFFAPSLAKTWGNPRTGLHVQDQLLTNLRGLGGFTSPNTLDRLQLIEKWSNAAGGAFRFHLAVVVRDEMIDPDKFGETLALNRGLDGRIFASESDAVTWLNSKHVRR